MFECWRVLKLQMGFLNVLTSGYMHQSFTPYRTAQRPIVKSVNYGSFVPVGT